ncbi:MAG: hypothetical protein IT190_03305 [Microbacteriaceae bacterium]|nr:hypothetical protein [Microbacteriaceae bacterium]
MRPPFCAVCDRDAEDGGGIVRFVSRSTDLEWRERAQQPGFVGHAPDTDWFCADHVASARALAVTDNIVVALTKMRE